MGKDLVKRLVSFSRLVDPGDLPRMKTEAGALEDRIARDLGSSLRAANLDPGYLDRLKVVLASTKDRGHRVYLGLGIFGEAALKFHHGRFWPFPWTYPDLAGGEALSFFERSRRSYLERLRD